MEREPLEVPHVGIVACSAEGAALCYRTICAEGAAMFGEHGHPEVSMHTHCLARYMVHVRANDQDGVAALMLSSAMKLAASGADFLICPDNTIHAAFERAARLSPVPWLHIARVVAEDAGGHGYKKLGVLGTRYLMEGPVYVDALADAGISREIPDEDERVKINDIIFRELVYGTFTDESRAFFGAVIDTLAARGCDAVVLGCTEIPLLIGPADSSLPVLDSTRLLARAALRRAYELVAETGGA